ncbi:3-keto-disaccharide hydrolase [Algibacter amylolyticus]|uniref:3-keto-disaccharide hydrolase n=1 Tax=Algibacter amylolyticus TaxID=1608400 RepID=UPI00155B21C6|nr:DUF1080 domain-containing protein [Algibacter amylolyticus]MBB5268735.1 hypothetical protein [Algibacter amylolyticus]
MRSIIITLGILLSLSINRSFAQEKLWKGTFQGWTFGYKCEPFDRGLYWHIQPNGDLLATGGDSYKTQSGMRTNEVYGDYELTLEYKWLSSGEDKKSGNSGIWIHGQEGFDQDNGAFPNSIEVQLRKTTAGDLLRKGLEIDQESGFPSKGEAVFRRSDSSTVEHFYNEWNTLKIRCEKDEISVWLNGTLINKAIQCRTISNEPVTSGYITLQAEFKDLSFRNIVIEKLEKDN